MVGGGGADYSSTGYATDPSSYGGWNAGGTLDNSQYGGQQNWQSTRATDGCSAGVQPRVIDAVQLVFPYSLCIDVKQAWSILDICTTILSL